MKKQWTACILAGMVLLGMTHAQAADLTGLTAPGAAQYRAVLDGLLEKYPVQVTEGGSGTLYAGLHDLDRNGSPELVTAWHNAQEQSGSLAHFDIYTVENGVVKRSYGDAVPSADIDHVLDIVSRDGQLYVHFRYNEGGTYQYHRYYTVSGLAEQLTGDLRLLTDKEHGDVTRTKNGKTEKINYKEYEMEVSAYRNVTDMTSAGIFSQRNPRNWCAKSDALSKITALREQLNGFAGTPIKQTEALVALDGKPVRLSAYEIEDSNYFKLRDLASVLSGTPKQFSVEYDRATGNIALTAGSAYSPVGGELAAGVPATSAPRSAQVLYANGKPLSLVAYEIGGNNYFKLRDIAQAMDFGVTWDEGSATVGILTTAGYTPA